MARLEIARLVSPDSNRASGLLAMLDEREYSLDQARRAEAWILVGDWSLKGANPTLELSDFYPTDTQLESTRAKLHPALVVVPRSALRPRTTAIAGPTATEPQPDSRGLLLEIVQLRNQLYDAERDLDRSIADNQRLQARIDRLSAGHHAGDDVSPT